MSDFNPAYRTVVLVTDHEGQRPNVSLARFMGGPQTPDGAGDVPFDLPVPPMCVFGGMEHRYPTWLVPHVGPVCRDCMRILHTNHGDAHSDIWARTVQA